MTKVNKLSCLLTLVLLTNLVVSVTISTRAALQFTSMMQDMVIITKMVLHSICYFQLWLIPYQTWIMSNNCSDMMDIVIDDISMISPRQKGVDNFLSHFFYYHVYFEEEV